MTFRFTRARRKPLHVDVQLYAHAESHGRRWDDQPARPTKFTQRLAVVLAIAVIVVCVAALAKLGGGLI